MPVAVKLSGNLATWLPRLQAFLPLQGWQVSGPIELTADANVSATRSMHRSVNLRSSNSRPWEMACMCVKPIVQGETKLVWDAATGSAAFANTMLQSTSLAVAADKMEIQTTGEAKISGSTALRVDLGKLLAWWNDPNVPSQTQCLGELEAEN